MSSFGIGGTNAHVVLEEAPACAAADEPASPQVLPLSARPGRSLDESTRRLAEHLALHPDTPLSGVANTLQVGRKAFAHRRCVVGSTPEQAIAALRDAGAWIDGKVDSIAPKVVFLFPGQGAQHVGMARGLYDGDPDFRGHVDACAAILEPLLGFDIRSILYPDTGQDLAARAEHLKQTEVAQPALFVVEYALARWFIERGVEPAAMIGHSVGEYVAACLAGVFSLHDALSLVFARGRLMQAQPTGAMIAVPLSVTALEPLLDEDLCLAAENAPALCVVAGPREAIAAFSARLASEQGIECRPLNTSHAFHSAMMLPAVDPFIERVRAITRHAPQRRYVSTVTGDWCSDADVSDAHFWARNIRDTVRFSRALCTVLDLGEVLFLEVGPGTTLTSLARKHKTPARTPSTVASLPHPTDGQDDHAHALTALARLWTAGIDVRWEALHAGRRPRRVALPSYAFQRERYWVSPDAGASLDAVPARRIDLEDWFYLPSWTRSGLARPPRPPSERWLIVAPGLAQAETIARAIGSTAGASEVWPLDSHESGETRVATGSDAEARLEEHVEALARSGQLPHHIVYVGTRDANASGDGGFHALLRLCRGLATGGGAPVPLSITVVCEGAYSVLGAEIVRAERVLPSAIARVFPVEMENVRCRVVDIETSQPDWPALVVDEALCDGADSLVAYRNGQRWRYTLEPIRLPQGSGAMPQQLRPGGVYLVTGGLDGMGLELAAHIARTVQAKVVLASRSAFPERHLWSGWMAERGPEDPVSRKILRIMQMESSGAQVMVARVDVSDAKGVEQLRERIHAEYGPLNGIVHAAGVAGGRTIALQTLESVAEVFAAKVHGTRILYECLRGDGLDFIVLCSSLTSVIPRAGRADYTAANLFLDAFAHGVRDTRVLAINWDNWTDTGMARAAASGAPLDGLSNDEGVSAFARALSHGGPQLLVSPRDLCAQFERVRRMPATKALTPAMGAIAHDAVAQPRPELGTAYEAPRNEIEATLASIWQELLGLAQVGVRDNFFDLGGDSVVSIQLTARARKAGLNITAKQVFENATIAELAAAAGSADPVLPSPDATRTSPSDDFALAPIQQWFFELPIARRNHWNLVARMETPRDVDVAALRSAVAGVLRSHDAFALRFRHEGDWRQRVVNAQMPEVEVVDLAPVPDIDIDAALERLEASMHASVDIAAGPTVRATFATLGPGRAGRLLIVAHHLAADLISLRVLAEDFDEAYARARLGERSTPPAATLPFAVWLARLQAYARSDAVAAELPYWSDQAKLSAATLPRDDAHASNTVARTDSVAVQLDGPTTKLLAATDAAGSGNGTLGALLGTLGWTLCGWCDAPHAWVDVEGHGRDAFAADIDVSRTVGWFTALHPMPLESGADLQETVDLARRRLRAMPARGFGYGVLRYLHPDRSVRAALAQTPRPEIVFLYQGKETRADAGGDTMRLLHVGGDGGRAKDQPRSHLLEINARIKQGRLHVDWVFNRGVHRRETIERLASRFEEGLRTLAAGERPPVSHVRAGELPSAVAVASARSGARLSFAQERIWFLQQLAPDSTLYNKQAVLRLAGNLDVDALVAALSDLVARHPALRTRVEVSDGTPLQVVDPPRRVTLDPVSLDHAPGMPDALAARWLAMVHEPFDLEADVPVRFALVRGAPGKHWLGVTFHHIATDAWSAQVFVRELGAIYSARRHRRAPVLPPLTITLADFAERQRASFTAAALARDLEFWTRALAGVEPLELPIDRPRPPVQSFAGKRVNLRWPAPLAAGLRGLARSSGVSLFTVLLAIFKVLLQRYSLQDDIAVGVPAADRPDVDTENLIGPLVNNLVMRTDLSGNPGFVQLLARVRNTTLAAHEHRDLPFEKLVEALHPERDRSRTPIFQVLFAFMNVPEAPQTWEGLDVALVEPDHGAAEFDLSLYCYDPPVGGELSGWIEYSTALFDAATIERLAGHLQRLAAAVVVAPERPIGEIALLSDAERRTMVVDWNRTGAAYPRDVGVHDLFERQADRHPARVAAQFEGDVTLTYGELDRRSNQLARHLRQLGVARDARVALCTDRSSAMLVGMLGILKAGGAYVPLDPSYPQERIAYMLADCGARILVTQARLGAIGVQPSVACVRLDADWSAIAAGSDARIDEPTDASALAYVIYTSGSTGNPKGVQIEHRAVVNFLNAMQARPGMSAEDRLLAVTTMSFDIHVLEIFLPSPPGEPSSSRAARPPPMRAASSAASLHTTSRSCRPRRRRGGCSSTRAGRDSGISRSSAAERRCRQTSRGGCSIAAPHCGTCTAPPKQPCGPASSTSSMRTRPSPSAGRSKMFAATCWTRTDRRCRSGFQASCASAAIAWHAVISIGRSSRASASRRIRSSPARASIERATWPASWPTAASPFWAAWTAR